MNPVADKSKTVCQNMAFNYLDPGDMFWLALDENDRVIGCIGYNSMEGTAEVKLHRLYVKYSLKHQGIGSALLKTAEEHINAQGKAAALVHLGEKEYYFESYHFYPKHGYIEYVPPPHEKVPVKTACGFPQAV